MPASVAALRAVHRDARAHEIASRQLYSNTRPAGASTRLGALSDIIPIEPPQQVGERRVELRLPPALLEKLLLRRVESP